MDEDYYKEHVLSIVNGGDGWNELYSSISEFKQHLNGGAALVEEELKPGWLLRHHSSNTSQLQYKIIALFKHIAYVWGVFGSRYLVQFWEAIQGEEGRCHYLSTSNQPFCVSTLRKGDSWYRNACMDHVYHVEEGAEAEQLGSVGRAYNNKQPESTPDLRLYSTEEFPLRDHAAHCGFRAYFTLPLFDLHHQNQCYGVLEVFSRVPTMENFLLCWLDRVLQNVGMRSTHINFTPIRNFSKQMSDKYKQQHNGEIRDFLELAIKAVPQLSLAQVWVPCKQCVNIMTNLCCMETISFINYKDRILNKCDYIDQDMEILDYLNACEFHNLQIDLSRFRRDLCHGNTSKNSLSRFAERARLPLSFAIYLGSMDNDNIDHFYVVEFFLQPNCRQDAHGDSSLNLLLRIIQMKLKRFNVVMDRQFQEEFVVQSRQPPNAIELESFDLLKSMDSYEEIFSELNFIKYLETVDLCCTRPSSTASNEGWVFRQPSGEELYGSEVNSPSLLTPRIPILKEKINHFMKELATTHMGYYCMVQFWAPKMVQGRCCLETWDQPYALSCLAKGLASFRRKCMTHRYFVDAEAKEEELGPPGRVFINGHPELFMDIFHYSTREFSLRSYAVHCNLTDYFALPVFDEDQQLNKRDCVGVLEFIGFLYVHLRNIGRTLKVAKLHSARIGCLSVVANDDRVNINNCRIEAKNEIEGALYMFTNIPQCYKANVWVSNGKCIDSNSRTMQFTLMVSGWWGEVNNEIYVEPNIGIHGMILESEGKSCFCRNIFGFSIAEQPLVHMTRSQRCSACFGICLQSSHTGDLLYVFEFFLYQGLATNEYIRSFLNFLLPIIKYELKTFKLASRKQLGDEELVVEVIEFSKDQLSSSDSDQLGVFPIMLKSVMYDQQEHQHNREHVQSYPEVGQVEQCNVATSNFKKTEKGKRENRLYLSLEVLKPHFGKKLVNVAQELGVGRSTIKRVCRKYGMNRWPNNERQTTNPSLFQIKSTQGHHQDMQPSSSSSNNLQGNIVALTTSSANTIVVSCTILNNNKNLNALHGQPSHIPNVCYNVSDEVGTRVACCDPLVVVQDKGPPKKKVQKTVVKERMVRSYALLPTPLKMLCICFNGLNDGRGIPITLDDDVFCNKCEIYVHLEDFMPFCDLEPISGNCIVVYIWHLYNKMKDENTLRRFQFVNPFTTSYVPNSQPDKRAHALADMFNYTSPNQLVLVPCNVGEHWILTIIQPYKEVISLLDPLGHCIREPWKDVVNMAISIFNVNLGKKGKEQPTWELIKAPLQPDFKQCGYYVMRYMKEIVQGLKTINSNSLSSLFVREGYSKTEINEVRIEWALRLQEHVPDSLYYKVAP